MRPHFITVFDTQCFNAETIIITPIGWAHPRAIGCVKSCCGTVYKSRSTSALAQLASQTLCLQDDGWKHITLVVQNSALSRPSSVWLVNFARVVLPRGYCWNGVIAIFLRSNIIIHCNNALEYLTLSTGTTQECYSRPRCEGRSFAVVSARECCSETDEGVSFSANGTGCTIAQCIGKDKISAFGRSLNARAAYTVALDHLAIYSKWKKSSSLGSWLFRSLQQRNHASTFCLCTKISRYHATPRASIVRATWFALYTNTRSGTWRA